MRFLHSLSAHIPGQYTLSGSTFTVPIVLVGVKTPTSPVLRTHAVLITYNLLVASKEAHAFCSPDPVVSNGPEYVRGTRSTRLCLMMFVYPYQTPRMFNSQPRKITPLPFLKCLFDLSSSSLIHEERMRVFCVECLTVTFTQPWLTTDQSLASSDSLPGPTQIGFCCIEIRSTGLLGLPLHCELHLGLHADDTPAEWS